MPSAVQVKSEKMPACDEIPASSSAAGALQVIEKKIRNMEKRKKKLDQVKARKVKGEKLDKDQQDALEHYREVEAALELLKDTSKQIQGIVSESEKQTKKQAKRALMEKQQEELQRFKELLHLNDVLQQLGDEDIRKDFQSGADGIVNVSEELFEDIDQLYKLISPDREALGEEFSSAIEQAAEHYQMLIDGKDRNVPETKSTYACLKQVLMEVSNCTYLSRLSSRPEAGDGDDGQQQDDQTAEISDEFEHVSLGEVPAADSEEVQSAIPPAVELDQQSTEDSSRDLQTIVSAVQGKFTFLQDSEIDAQPQQVSPASLQYSSPGSQPTEQSTVASFDSVASAQEQIPFDAPVVSPAQPSTTQTTDNSYSNTAAFSSEYSNYSNYPNPSGFEQVDPMSSLGSGLGQFGQSNIPSSDLNSEESKFPNVSAQSFEPAPASFGQVESEPAFQEVNYRNAAKQQGRGGGSRAQSSGFSSRGQSSQRGAMYNSQSRDSRPQNSYNNSRPRNSGFGGNFGNSRGGGDYSSNGGSSYGGQGQYNRRGAARGGRGGMSGSRQTQSNGQRSSRGGYGQAAGAKF